MNRQNWTEENKEISKRYNSIPDCTPDDTYPMIGIGMMIIFFVGIFAIGVATSGIDDYKDELAKEIIEIRENDVSCTELTKRFKYESYKSQMEWELERKIYNDRCMSDDEIQEIKHVKYCKIFDTVDCRIEALMNPQIEKEYEGRR